jgi:type I restriction enzyme S subunit
LEGLVSPAYTVCEPQPGTHSLLFSYYFKTPQLIEQFQRFSQGLVKDTLNLKYPAFALISASVPTYPEQQKIAECLSSVDELIVVQARKLDALKTHKKGLMQQLFPREGETQPRLRFPEFQDAGDWVEYSLGQLIEIASGQVDPKQPPYCDSPQIGSENIESHSGKLVNVKSAGEKGVISGNYAFDENDILYSKIRPALNKVAAPEFKGICSADIYPIRPADGTLLRSYLFYLLLSQDFLDYAIQNSERGKIPKINRDALVTYKALIPLPAEQQRIADCLSSLDDLIPAQTQTLEALKTHKQGLMQQLFPSPEAASA